MQENIRNQAFAGKFYPAAASELRNMIQDMLKGAESKPTKANVWGLVAPHAGYIYSGPVAAESYSAVSGKQYDDVIIIAPSHRAAFTGSTVFTADGYATPLGVAKADRAFAELITIEGKSEMVKFADDGHTWRDTSNAEHSLEVQIPFLQTVLPGVPIVPIVMGTQDQFSCSELVNAITRALKVSGKKVLVVASSDLTHYKSPDAARQIDSHFIDCLSSLDYFRLQMECASQKAQACGWGPVSVMMMIAEYQGGLSAKMLKYSNSAESRYVDHPDSSSVVGYAAGIISDEPATPGLLEISAYDKAFAIRLAKENVESVVRNGKRIEVPKVLPDLFSRKAAAFVTLTKKGNLRGCIGHTIASVDLCREIIISSASAASDDYRFGKVRTEELGELKYEISVLTRMKRVFSFDEIHPGQHGLYIRFAQNSGLLLPQVASERRWTVKEFLENVAMKAGIPRDFYKKQEAEIFTFEAIVIK